jgi:hypothetical protein
MTGRDRPTFDAAFWFQWIIATTVGWVLARVLLPNISDVAAGVGASVLQWPILYQRVPKAWRWAVASAGTWIAGSILLATLPGDLQFLLGGLILGAMMGIAQWFILRQEVRWAGWWIVMSMIAWITGLTLIPGILSTGTLVSAMTGVALMLLSHNYKPPHPTEPEAL